MGDGSGRLHSSSRYWREVARLVREQAASDPDARCPVCGDRPPDENWHADHIAACWPDSPLIAACARCNTRRPNRIPSASFALRLGEPTTIWSCGTDAALEWLTAAAVQRYGPYGQRHYLLVIARAPNWDGYYRRCGSHVRLDLPATLLEQHIMAVNQARPVR